MRKSVYESRKGDYRNIFINGYAPYFPFLVEQVGTDYCDKDYFLERNNSSLSVIGYTFTGKGIIIQDGKKYVVEENQFFILQNEHSHCYFPKENWAFCWFNIVGNFNRIIEFFGLSNHVVISCNLGTSFSSAVNKCIKAEDGLLKAQIFAQSFIISLLPHFKNAVISESDNKTDIESKIKIALEKVCFSQYSFTSICSKLGITERHAQRLFKQKYGVSPHEYVLQLRYQEACSLLMLPSQTIKEIAYVLGFNDEKYFSVFFKKRSGFYPSTYRKLVRKWLLYNINARTLHNVINDVK